MESVGAISESEWSSFSAMYSNEESEFTVQLLNNCSTPNDFHDGSSFRVPSFWPDHESMSMAGVDIVSINSLDNTNINVKRLSVGSSSYNDRSSFFFRTSSHDSYYTSDSDQILWTNNDSMLNYCIEEAKVTNSPGQVCTNNLLEGDNFLNQNTCNDIIMESGGNLPKADILEKHLQLGSEALLPEPEPAKEVELKNTMQKSKKRCCNSGDVQKNKRNVNSRKKQKLNLISKNEEENNSAIPRENSSSYYSEDDSDAFHELNGGRSSTSDSKGAVVVNKSGKTRANRGSATDPQSLYARKRRERINERLRTLQNLVPNGTKVDISTMLEEAVQYVKFLQLQIKL